MNTNPINKAAVLFVLTPIIFFAIYLFVKAVNVPYGDDTALFLTVNHWDTSFTTIVSTIFQQHNEHRIVFSRLAMLLVYQVTDFINFRYVILLGFLNLVVLTYTLYLYMKPAQKSIYYFLPIVILVFSPVIHTNHLWAITSFEYTLAILFALLTLYFLQPTKSDQWGYAILFASAAPLANLDGICVLPIGLVWLLLQRRKKESWIFGGFITSYIAVYFLTFTFNNSLELPPFVELLWVLVKGTLAFVGGICKIVSDTYAVYLAIVLGAFMVAVLLFFILRNTRHQAADDKSIVTLSVIEMGLLHLCACGLLIALGRASSTLVSMVADRFQIYAVAIACLFYVLLISNLKQERYQRWILQISICLSLMINVLSYVKYDSKTDYHKNKLQADAFNFTHHSLFLHQFHSDNDPPRPNYRNYQFPTTFTEKEITAWVQQVKNVPNDLRPQVSISTVDTAPLFENSIYPLLKFEVDNIPVALEREDVFLGFFDSATEKQPYLAAFMLQNEGWVASLLSQKQNELRSNEFIIAQKMPTGTYDLALCWKKGNQLHSKVLAKNILIGNAPQKMTEINSNE